MAEGMMARFKVTDRSMEPSFNEGDFVLVEKFSYLLSRPRENDVVVLRHPHNSKFLLKRISKTINGAVFVEGDNKTESEDSRQFGPVSKREIVGKVLVHIRKN